MNPCVPSNILFIKWINIKHKKNNLEFGCDFRCLAQRACFAYHKDMGGYYNAIRKVNHLKCASFWFKFRVGAKGYMKTC